MYGKIFDSMYEGTLYGHWEAIVTLQQMLVLCSQDGVLDMTPQAIAARTSIPLDIITKGIGILSEPDPYTRTPGEEGRRIVLLDDHRPWGWVIVNYAKYRDLVNRAQKNEADRVRIAGQRAGKESKKEGFVYFVGPKSGGHVKIGFSANPWSRISELQIGHHEPLELLCVVPGTHAYERSLHAEFVALRTSNEWFSRSEAIDKRINELNANKKRGSATSHNVADVAHATASAEASTTTPNSTPSAATADKPRSTAAVIGYDIDKKDFTGITGIDHERWGNAYPAVHVPREIAAAAAWLAANPKNRKSNYQRFLVNWFGRAQERAPRVAGGVLPAGHTPKPWWTTVPGIDAKGAELNITIGKDENWQYFKARVFAAAGTGPWNEADTARRVVNESHQRASA